MLDVAIHAQYWREAPPVCRFVLPCRVLGKKRHTKDGRTPRPQFVFENEIVAERGREAFRKANFYQPWSGIMGVRIALFYFAEARDPDIDNAIKTLFDGFNEILWDDDRQVKYKEVVATACRKLDEERAEIEVLVF